MLTLSQNSLSTLKLTVNNVEIGYVRMFEEMAVILADEFSIAIDNMEDVFLSVSDQCNSFFIHFQSTKSILVEDYTQTLRDFDFSIPADYIITNKELELSDFINTLLIMTEVI